MRAFAALALNSFREARRNKVTLVVALFALLLLLASSLLAEVTVVTYKRVLTDFGLGAMTLLLVFLTIFLSTGQLTREIERRTIYLVVTKPVSRTVFLFARLTGNMVTIAGLLALMGAVFIGQLLVLGLSPTTTDLVAIGMLWFELLVLSCVGFALASFSGQVTSALVTTLVFLAGHLSTDLYALGERAKSTSTMLLGKACYYLLPNLERLNFRPQAAHAASVSMSEVGSAALYTLAYSFVVLAIAVFIFERRDFK